jgi:GntR family transcriptional regulator/MocR family aminotransferase
LQTQWIGEALAAELDRQSKEGLSRQLVRLLRQWIAAGRLPGNARLPASRDLAHTLTLGRNTVLEAYEQLLAEGYVVTRPGAGTFVCGLFDTAAPAPAARRLVTGLSARGVRLQRDTQRDDQYTGAFIPCIPEIRHFPYHAWQQLLTRHQRQASVHDFNYQSEGGVRALREALADYLSLSRSVRCHADRILITHGTQESLSLCAHMLADPGDVAWMEDPGYTGARTAMQSAGLDLVAAPVDAAGLNPALVTDPRPPRLIYATPSHQYPCGVTMPLERRLALLQRAEASNAWIIEDDYDSEFRYDSQPLPALQGMANDERVIYLGTMSKVMYPGLRIGYIVVPDALIDAFRSANARLFPEGHYPLQSALAEFIDNGQFARHIRAMRELYQQRQHVLRRAFARSAAESWYLSPGQAGMHLIATLPDHLDEERLRADAARERIWLATMSRSYLASPGRQGLILGYAGVAEHEIERGVDIIARLAARR